MCIAITTNAHAQNEHRMTIGDMYGLIDQHNRTIRAGKTAVAAADEGVRAASWVPTRLGPSWLSICRTSASSLWASIWT